MHTAQHTAGRDEAVAAAEVIAGETGHWRVDWTVEKYHENIADFEGSAQEFYERFSPYETIEREGNLLLNEGIALLLDLLIGAGGTPYNNANAQIGVGDSATAAAATQTDLQAATNKLFKGMDATFPSRTNQTVTWKATFGGAEANWAWNEWAIRNSAAAGIDLNRRVESLGTKVSGTWTITVTVTVS